jgi:prophage regulatory protein
MEDISMASQAPDRFLRLDSVLDRTGLSRATLYRKIQAGTFPKQVRISERCCAWRESEVTEWQMSPFTYDSAK